MSIKAMNWAWEQNIGSTEKLVLIAVADHSDNEGFCWPGQKGIAEKCSVRRETVNRALKNLEDRGLISSDLRYDVAGRTVGKAYRLKLGGPVTNTHTPTPPVDHMPVSEPHGSKENPHKEPSEEECKDNISPKLAGRGEPFTGFVEFWAAWPRRVQRLAAEKAWSKLTVEERTLALTALPAHMAAWSDPQFIPYPASWLNGKRWQDEIPRAVKTEIDGGLARRPVGEAVNGNAGVHRDGQRLSLNTRGAGGLDKGAVALTPEQLAANRAALRGMVESVGKVVR